MGTESENENLEIDGYTEAEIEEIMASDDPEAIEAMLEGRRPESDDSSADPESGGDQSDDEPDGEPAQEPEEAESDNADDKDGADTSGADDDAEPEEKATDDPEDQPYVESKNGEHKIPYAVLESARRREQQARQELQEAKDKLQQLEGSSSKMASVLKQQGIDLDSMEDGDMLTEEQLADIADADPTIAKAIGMLQSRLQATTEQLQSLQTQEVVDPIELAIRENTDLNTWRRSDPDRWATAVDYDDLLRQDPAFKDKPMEERFAEAVLRTKKLFGDPVDADDPGPSQKTNSGKSAAERAREKVDAASKQSTPKSLTDVGRSPGTEKPLVEQIKEMDESELEARFSKMSQDQIDQVLADLAAGG